jgi:hypothetical protein
VATQTFHSKIAAEAGTASNELTTRSQLDAAEASAKNRANHTGTQLASTISDFAPAVDARIQNIVGAAPAALDTLQELADALGDDPNYAATVTGQLNAIDTRIDALESASTAGSYVQAIGDAAASLYTVTHNLGSLDVRVEVVRVSDGQTVYPVVQRPSANTVSVDFGTFVPASASHRVLITKVG